MSKAAWVLIGVALLTIGYAAGWHQKGVSVDAATVRADRQQHQAEVKDLTQQITDHTAKLQAEQDKSAGLYAQQRLLHAAGVNIRLEISNAVFQPAERIGVTPSCPDPSGSPEFERLYDAAAQGGATAHSGTAGAGGVP